MIKTDIVIIGAGASGMMAAHFCAQKGKEVYLLDHNKQVGRKIIISGGGKCNFTNRLGSNSSDYDSQNPHFVKSALSRYGVHDFMELIERYGVPYEERALGKLFCLRSAKDINKMLSALIDKPNIKLCLEQSGLQVEKVDEGFHIFNNQLNIFSSKLIIATGGLVLPEIGASDFGYVIAKKFGHKIIPTRPALVPFTIPGFTELAGNAFVVGITCNRYYVEENVLFTHKGLSGPAILKTSLFWNHDDPIEINWLPNDSIEAHFRKSAGGVQLSSVLKKIFPNSFVQVFLNRIQIDPTILIANLTKEIRDKIQKEIHSTIIVPSGTEGFRKAEVTRGGICTSKVSSKTMESQLQKGLYFIGEVLDVTGQLGGHNFQWCWASAFAAGEDLK